MAGKRSTGSEGGFTLIEVAITMFFLTIIVQSMAMVSLYAQRSGKHARHMTSANMIAEQALEKYRNTAYANLPTVHNDQRCFDAHMWEVNCAASTSLFTRTTLVTPDTPLNDVSEVDVTVTWEENWAWGDLPLSETGTQQAKVVTYISRY